VQSKADVSQLNLPHGTKTTTKSGKQKNEKVKKTDICSEVSVNSPGMRGVSPEEEKEGYDGKDL